MTNGWKGELEAQTRPFENPSNPASGFGFPKLGNCPTLPLWVC